MLWVAALGHALCHVATLVLQQVVMEAGRDLAIARERIGWVVALGPFLMGFGAVPAGALADRFGLRRIYRGYLLLLAFGALLAAVAPGAWLFVAAVALVGLAASCHHPVGLAWIGEALPAQRAQAIGIHGFVGHFGSTLAPFLVLVLAQGAGWRATYLLIATVALLLLGVAWRSAPTAAEDAAATGHRDGGRRSSIPWRLALASPVVVVLLAMVANGFVHQGFWSSWTSLVRAHAGVLPEAPATPTTLLPLATRLAALWPGATSLLAVAGFLATFVCAFGSFGELFGARLARRGGGLRTYALMNALSALGLAGVAQLGGGGLLAAGALFTFCHFGTQPLENELIARRVDPRVRGVAYGLKFVVSFGLGSLAADPTIRGWQQHGFPLVAWALAGLALGGALASLLLARSEPRSPVAS